ncbi:hypothetical protein [Roseomonas sp. HF4]|uniref:hypothetical protein n=1 Tax=Roseomonas sp. HF4 TaxID=2562313 RepID=UPI0010C0EC6E|nr:hypothetical protein [Roseomonas sp. HF4]
MKTEPTERHRQDPTAAIRAPGAARRPVLALALALAVLGGCAAIEGASRPSLDAVAAAMPREIAGFVRGDVAPRSGPTLSMDYATANRAAVATVLVYETGGRVPSDPEAAEIDRELTSAVSEVTDAPYGRTGRRLTERERVTVADPGMRCAMLHGAFGRAPVTRHVCVGTAAGRFVKMQITMSDRLAASVDAQAFAAGALRAVRGA